MGKVLTSVPTTKQKRTVTVTLDDPVVDGLILPQIEAVPWGHIWGSLVWTYVSRESDDSSHITPVSGTSPVSTKPRNISISPDIPRYSRHRDGV